MSFDKMMKRAKGREFARDLKRAEAADKGERYEVLAFPAVFGSPIRTNCWALAWIIAYWREPNYAEIRIIDRTTGKHYVLGGFQSSLISLIWR